MSQSQPPRPTEHPGRPQRLRDLEETFVRALALGSLSGKVRFLVHYGQWNAENRAWLREKLLADLACEVDVVLHSVESFVLEEHARFTDYFVQKGLLDPEGGR